MAITRGNTNSSTRSATGTDASVTLTVQAGATLLVVTTMFEAGETVTATPSWSGNGTPQDLTLVDATTSSGDNADVALATYALENPTAETTGTITVTHSSNDNAISVATEYFGTNASATMTENIALLQEDVNDTGTGTTVFASAGESGNCLYGAAVGKGGDGTPASNGTSFNENFDGASGGSGSADISGYVCDLLDAAPEALTITWTFGGAGTDENAGHYLEIKVLDTNFVVLPGKGAITLAGTAPTVVAPITVSVPTGSITTSGKVPVVDLSDDQDNVPLPGKGTLALSGKVPVVVVSDDQDNVPLPGAGSLTISGKVPIVVAPVTVNPAVGSLTLSGKVPVVSLSDDQDNVVLPGSGSLTLSGKVPIVVEGVPGGDDIIVTPPAGSLTLTGQTPFRQSLVWINTVPSKDGNEVLSPVRGDESATSISFDDTAGAPVGTVYIGVEKADGKIGWSIAQTVNENQIVLPGSATLTLVGKPPTVVLEVSDVTTQPRATGGWQDFFKGQHKGQGKQLTEAEIIQILKAFLDKIA